MDSPKNDALEVRTSLFTPEKEEAVLRRLNELYKNSGISIPSLVRVTGLSESTVTRYVTGKTKDPHVFTMVTLIVAMGGNLYDILGLIPPSDPVAVSAPVGNPYGELIDTCINAAQSSQASNEKLSSSVEILSKKLNRNNRIIILLSAVLALLLCVFCVLEIVDLCNPDWGRYQWATELFGDFLRKL